jgi:hypothetical protein
MMILYLLSYNVCINKGIHALSHRGGNRGESDVINEWRRGNPAGCRCGRHDDDDMMI